MASRNARAQFAAGAASRSHQAPAPAQRHSPLAPPVNSTAQTASALAMPQTAWQAQNVVALQRTVGNRNVLRLMRRAAIQAKLTVGPADDTYEREADAVADTVTRAPAGEPAASASPTTRLPEIQPTRPASAGMDA